MFQFIYFPKSYSFFNDPPILFPLARFSKKLDKVMNLIYELQ